MEVRRIVDSMSHWELIDLYKQEIPFSEHKINEQLKKCVRMLYDSHKELTVFRPTEYKRKSGFNIVVQTFDRGTSFPKKERPGFLLYFWFNYRCGISAIKPLEHPKYGLVLSFLTSHFIERFRERGLKDVNISKPDAINQFFIRNPKRAAQYHPSEKYPDNGYIVCNDGICMVEAKDCFIIYKTFLSWEQVSAKQKGVSVSVLKTAAMMGDPISVPEELIEEDEVKSIDLNPGL